MKIAILSMQRVVNHGSVLQAWSLREMVREATGETADFLDIEDAPALKSRRTVTEAADYAAPASLPGGLMQRGKRWCIARLSAWNKRLIRRFMAQELHLDAANSCKAYDHVIIGSDEVFNHVRDVRLQLHGDVRQAANVLTYAASCGSALAEDIAPEDRSRVRQAMNRLSAVSVRDAGTQTYAAALYDGLILRHLDPVLMGPLHARRPRPVRLKRFLLVYAYGQRIRTEAEIGVIRAFAREKGLKIVAVGGSQFWCDLYIPASPLRLLDYFCAADYVVTDTFHGAIFSVITRRPFAVIVRQSNANKLTGLLTDLGLQTRRLTDMSQLPAVLTAPIDYDQVDALLAHERLRAHEYLKEQLMHERGENQPDD